MPTISFARGAPAPELLPVDELVECAQAALARDGRSVLAYGSGAGYEPLRDWLAERHGVDRERIMLTNGSLQGFVLLVQHLATRGPLRVLVEAPTYDRPLKVLAAHGARVDAVAVDDDGLDVDGLAEAIDAGPEPSLVYTIPTFQNPSGRTLTLERRERLAALARERSLLVLEDDPYGAIRFEGEPLPSVFELAGGENVIYTSSFSKTVAPGLRVGWLVLPTSLAAAFERIAVSTYISPVLPAQATAYEYVRRGLLEPNVARISALLSDRRDAMIAAVERQLPAGTRVSRPHGGYFVWVDLPAEVDAGQLLDRATAAGVAFVKGSDFFPDGRGGRSALRLAYSFVRREEIELGISRLASLLPAAAAV